MLTQSLLKSNCFDSLHNCSCELILNSARLNSNVQISTRNSCKTLKCPQCNWHYKYQETLEIHMREKHPDGESACGYCLAGKNIYHSQFQRARHIKINTNMAHSFCVLWKFHKYSKNIKGLFLFHSMVYCRSATSATCTWRIVHMRLQAISL